MITIRIKDSDLKRYLNALNKLRTTVETFGKDEMQRRCAVDYYQLVVKNILNTTSPQPSYRGRYGDWKKKYGWMGYPSPGRLRGDLIKNMTAFKDSGNGWWGGIVRGTMDQGGKSWFGKGSKGPGGGSRDIGKYGWVMEKGGDYSAQGGGRHPGRPVFEPTAKEYAREGWGKRGQEALNELKKAWS